MAPPVTATALIAAVRAVAVAEGRPGNEPARALDALERLPPQGMLTLHQAVDMLANAFLDDAYLTCDPERVRATFLALRQALKSHANIDLNVGKTRVWNAAGEEPPALSEWMPPAQDGSPVWVGDPTLPPELQGIHVLGTPLGHDAFRKAALLAKRCQHDSLLDKLPGLPNLQTAWLLLLMCACPHSNYLLRTMQPSITEDFAARHDRAIMGCLSELLGSDGATAPGRPGAATRQAAATTRRTGPPLGRGRPLRLLGLVGRHIAHVAGLSPGAGGCRVPAGRERRRGAGHKRRR